MHPEFPSWLRILQTSKSTVSVVCFSLFVLHSHSFVAASAGSELLIIRYNTDETSAFIFYLFACALSLCWHLILLLATLVVATCIITPLYSNGVLPSFQTGAVNT